MKKVILLSLIFPLSLSVFADFRGEIRINKPPHHHRPHNHRARHNYPSHLFISTSKAKSIATNAVGGGRVVNLLLRQGQQVYEAEVENNQGKFLVIIEALNGKLLEVIEKN